MVELSDHSSAGGASATWLSGSSFRFDACPKVTTDMPSAPRFAAELAKDLSPEDFCHVLALLRNEISQLVEKMELGAQADDTEAFHRAAHGLVGSAGAGGAAALEQSAHRAMTRSPDGPSLIAMAFETRQLFNAVLIEIDAALAGSAQS